MEPRWSEGSLSRDNVFENITSTLTRATLSATMLTPPPHSHAHYSLGHYDESIKAYTHGLTLDPNNANMKQALAQATAKAKQAEQGSDDEDDDAGVVPGRSAGGPGGMPDMSALAALMGSMGGGAGGAGGPGGMPDLAGLMSNPAVMQM